MGSYLSWDHAGGGPTRAAVRPWLGHAQVAGDWSHGPRWVLSHTPGGQPIAFVGQASVVAVALPQPRVVAIATIAGQTRVLCVDAETGSIVWNVAVASRSFDSWSSPAIDTATGSVLVASGDVLACLALADGAERWRVTLAAPVVNASPLVLDAGSAQARVFISDFGGFGGPSALYAVALAPRAGTLHPFDPGHLVWTAPIGSASGASPAGAWGVVYVASTGLDGSGAGEVRAFDGRDAGASGPPAPLWTFTNPLAEGFFGGVSIAQGVVQGPSGPVARASVYAASYAFFGGQASANLVAIDARDGAGRLRWSVEANRTSSTPVPTPDGRVVLSTGVLGFGSVPSVQLFAGHDAFALPLWDTALDTWTDANANGTLDLGEFLLAGGWTAQPAVVQGPGGTVRVLVGVPFTGSGSGPPTALLELDGQRVPTQSGFVAQQRGGAGSSPALLGLGVYSAGAAGLVALGHAPPRADLSGDGRVGSDDLYAWEAVVGSARDVDRTGAVDGLDRALLRYELRRTEASALIGGAR